MPDAAYFREQARKCRRLSRATGDDQVGETLRKMANEYDTKARELETPH